MVAVFCRFGSRCVLASLFLAAAYIPAQATVIIRSAAALRSGALLTGTSSYSQMRASALAHKERVFAAGKALGLDRRERLALLRELRDGHSAHWMKLPQHLDGMTFLRGGQVGVLDDVYVPAGTRGWQIRVPSAKGELVLFIAAECGNISFGWRNGAGTITYYWREHHRRLPFPPSYPPEFAPPQFALTPPVPYAPSFPEVQSSTSSRRPFPWWIAALLLPLIPHNGGGGGSTIGPPVGPPAPPPPPDTFQCWEAPNPHCDRPGSIRIRIGIRIP